MKPEQDLIARLTERGWLLALAESCTGGLVAARLTAIPGASTVLLGGVVAYSNDVKRDVLNVPNATLEGAGAVSTEAALAMAQGARRLFHAQLAAAITGIAGPGGGSPAKPVGLVHIAVSGPHGDRVERFLFDGDRAAIRDQAADAALRMLLDHASQSR